MSRITDRLLVQRVDDRLVLIDESSGEEVEIPMDVVPNVIGAMAYLSDLVVTLKGADPDD